MSDEAVVAQSGPYTVELQEGRDYWYIKRLRFYFAMLRGKKPSREWMFVGAEVRRLLEESKES